MVMSSREMAAASRPASSERGRGWYAGEFTVTGRTCQTVSPGRSSGVIPEAAERLSGIHGAGGEGWIRLSATLRSG